MTKYVTSRTELDNQWFVEFSIATEVNSMYGDPEDVAFLRHVNGPEIRYHGSLDLKLDPSYRRANLMEKARHDWGLIAGSYTRTIYPTKYLRLKFLAEGDLAVQATPIGIKTIKRLQAGGKSELTIWQHLFGTGWSVYVGSDVNHLFSGEVFYNIPQGAIHAAADMWYDNSYAVRSASNQLAQGNILVLYKHEEKK